MTCPDKQVVVVVNLEIGDFDMLKRSGLDYLDEFDKTLSIQVGYWRISEVCSRQYGRNALTIDVIRTAPVSGSLLVTQISNRGQLFSETTKSVLLSRVMSCPCFRLLSYRKLCCRDDNRSML